MSVSRAPAGFHEHASGLIVPEAHARKRIVTTKGDWKKVEQALAILKRVGLRTAFRCENEKCSPVVKSATPDGGTLVRCDCSDRIFTKAF